MEYIVDAGLGLIGHAIDGSPRKPKNVMIDDIVDAELGMVGLEVDEYSNEQMTTVKRMTMDDIVGADLGLVYGLTGLAINGRPKQPTTIMTMATGDIVNVDMCDG